MKKRKNQFKTKKFTITIQNSATPSFKKSLPRDSTKRNAPILRHPLIFRPALHLTCHFSFCMQQRIFNKLGSIARYYIIGFHASRFVVYVSHNNVWRHWRKTFFEQFCLLIVIILFLLHNYFIIPKLASTRSNRAKRVQNCLPFIRDKKRLGRSTAGVKMEKE